MSTTITTLGRAASHLLTRHLQADRKARPRENVDKPTTQVSAPTLTVDLNTHRKDKVCQPKEPGKAKAKASSMARERPEAKHLDPHPEIHIEAPPPQVTAEPLPAENG